MKRLELVLAVLALVIASGSLAWQIVSSLDTLPGLEVVARRVTRVQMDDEPGTRVAYETGECEIDSNVPLMEQDGLEIQVLNPSQRPQRIVAWGFSDGETMVATEAGGAQMPVKLEDGDTVAFWIPAEALESLAQSLTIAPKRVFVRTSRGEEYTTDLPGRTLSP